MAYVSIRFDVDARAADAWSDALIERGALSVDVSDPAAGTPDERPLYAEPGVAVDGYWPVARIEALVAAGVDARALVAATAGDIAATMPHCETRPVGEADWVRATQAQFGPIRIADDFWIVPTWCEPPDPRARILRLDPGLAFGTGSHPTTRLCLEWLVDTIAGGEQVLDYGCGSGILAIGAALHGATGIDAVDIDPAAVESTRANAAANGVTIDRVGLPDLAGGEYPVVLANILAAPLKLLAPLLSAHVAPGGSLVLAGLLERQIEDLQAAYAPWLALEVADREEGWILLSARRP